MHEPLAIANFLVIVFTTIFTYRGFNDPRFVERFIFRPESILASKEYYRMFTSALLHANWTHLIFNMLSLYLFGRHLELFLGVPQFLAIYVGAIVGGSLLSLLIHRQQEYRAYGASGGVCGIIFAYIFVFPGGGVSFFPFPYLIPAWLYAIAFVLGSFYGIKSQRDNIGHDAHLGGAIVGLLIASAFNPWIIQHSPKLFAAVLLLSVLLLISLWKNPLSLPTLSVFRPPFRTATKRSAGDLPNYKQEQLRVDELLEKISRTGMESLTAEERAFLKSASDKHRRRAESQKPQSELPF